MMQTSLNYESRAEYKRKFILEQITVNLHYIRVN